jgi:orotate phosphoribosyltransferase
MLSYEESLKILKETNALLEGHFILSSGLHSAQYIQCAQLLSKPHKSANFCKSLAEKISKELNKIDLILSPAMGGIVIGYEIGRLLNVETIFSERVDGQFKLRRDFQILKNSKVLIVEDVITTGKSSIECSKLVEKAGAKLVGFACIISQLEINIPTYKEKDLPKRLISLPAIKPGSRDF